MVLKGVLAGDTDDSPALRNLIACGLVEDGDGPGGLRVTAAGRCALDASKKSRTEVWARRVLAVSVIVVALGGVVDWIAG